MGESVYERLSAVLAGLPAVGKDSSNAGQNFPYRSQDAILNAVKPLLAAHGLLLTPECLSHSYEPAAKGWIATVLVKYHAIAADGSRCELGPVPGVGHDTFDKAMTKAMTYAFKTFLGQAFAIATEDDPDGESPEVGKGRVKSPPAAAEERPRTQGHLIAEAATKAGFRANKEDDAGTRKQIDDARRDVLQAATGKRSTKDLAKAQEVKAALDAFNGIADGRLELAYDESGGPVLRAPDTPATSPKGG